jgi:hypothetical protein
LSGICRIKGGKITNLKFVIYDSTVSAQKYMAFCMIIFNFDFAITLHQILNSYSIANISSVTHLASSFEAPMTSPLTAPNFFFAIQTTTIATTMPVKTIKKRKGSVKIVHIKAMNAEERRATTYRDLVEERINKVPIPSPPSNLLPTIMQVFMLIFAETSAIMNTEAKV